MITTARQPLRLLCALACAGLAGALACGAGSRADLLIEDVWPRMKRGPVRWKRCSQRLTRILTYTYAVDIYVAYAWPDVGTPDVLDGRSRWPIESSILSAFRGVCTSWS